MDPSSGMLINHESVPDPCGPMLIESMVFLLVGQGGSHPNLIQIPLKHFLLSVLMAFSSPSDAKD